MTRVKSRGARIAIRVVVAVVALMAVAAGALGVLGRPLSRAEVDEAITGRLEGVVRESASVESVLFTVASGSTGALMQYAVGTTHADSREPVSIDSPYHSASVGKTMLATVFGQLVDEGTVTLDDTVSSRLEAGLLDGLFVYEGVDLAAEVTIGQLLSHTSGVGDYFAGPVTSGATMLEIITAAPDTYFTPDELVAFTRERQVAVGSPGESFAYSDTGYVLLGLLLEQIEGKPYKEVLDARLFEPLGMHASYFMTEFGTGSAILAVEANGIDLSTHQALSVDWAGGGVVTTMGDLLTFMRALEGGELVSERVFSQLTEFEHSDEAGVHYGMGMVQFRFSELSPLLFAMSDLHGAVGATGTFALYDPTTDTYYLANFGSLDFAEKAIEQLVEIRLILDRLER